MASFPVDFVLGKVDQLVTNEANLLLGLDDEIRHVKRKLEFLQVFLADADRKRRDTQHPKVGVWVKHLREVAYDLEDVLEEYTVKLDLQRMGFSGWRASPWLHCCISPTTQLIYRHELASRIRNIKVTLEEIASDKTMFLDPINLASSSQDSPTDVMINILRTEVEEEPTGLNKYVEKLIPQILKSKDQRLVIIPIFGMGGLGKTTLAKRLYSNKEVTSHFNLRVWLTVSQTSDFVDLSRRLLKELVLRGERNNEDEMNRKREDQITLKDIMQMDEDEIKTKLKDCLSKKRFIIVLDDIWDIRSWEYLKTMFPREHEGITVLLTTRNKTIAIDANPYGEPFELQPLEPEESWELFCKKAFTDANCPENFHVFKKAVIKRGKRLPLALVVLGGLLRKTKDPNQWQKILDMSKREEDEVVSILYLSYDYLPHHLKACFLYIAGYLEDCVIDARELKLMWIAEGFVQKRQGQTMEDSADEYLEELKQRSLIQLSKLDGFIGLVEIIRVHDLVLDMARKEAQEIKFLYYGLPQESSIPARRLSICYDGDDGIDNYKHLDCLRRDSTLKLRSFHLSFSSPGKEFPSKVFYFHSTKFVRVLIFKGINFQNGQCPEAIVNMIQLRYLRFAKTNLKELPYSISNLQNLQTLDLRGTRILKLPKKFWAIASLSHVMGLHLDINPTCKQDVNIMNELQTLMGIPNYKWIINDGLKKLTNIRELNMLGLYCESDNIDIGKLEERVLEAIDCLKHLTHLLLWHELSSMKFLTASNTSLQRLLLWGKKGVTGEHDKNLALQPLLPNLHMLVITEMYLTQNEIDVIGLLPNLKCLTIDHEFELTKMVFKDGFFSCLKQLEFHDCKKLESWEVNGDWSKSTPMLQLLKIDHCPQLTLLPQGLQVKEIQLGRLAYDDGEVWIKDEVRLWAEQMADSQTKTIVTVME